MTGEFPDDSQSSILLLYDGVCALCNRLVVFLLRHDHCDRFRFAPLQSELAGSVLRRYGLSTQNFEGVVVLANFGRADERMLIRSEAVLVECSRGNVPFHRAPALPDVRQIRVLPRPAC
jgi:predicted DCC family thiol-disulfide oxidoreductase YuxK